MDCGSRNQLSLIDRRVYAFSTLVSHEKLIEETKAGYYLALNKTQRVWETEGEDVGAWLLYIFNIFLKQAKAAQTILESDQFEYLLDEQYLLPLSTPAVDILPGGGGGNGGVFSPCTESRYRPHR